MQKLHQMALPSIASTFVPSPSISLSPKHSLPRDWNLISYFSWQLKLTSQKTRFQDSKIRLLLAIKSKHDVMSQNSEMVASNCADVSTMPRYEANFDLAFILQRNTAKLYSPSASRYRKVKYLQTMHLLLIWAFLGPNEMFISGTMIIYIVLPSIGFKTIGVLSQYARVIYGTRSIPNRFTSIDQWSNPSVRKTTLNIISVDAYGRTFMIFSESISFFCYYLKMASGSNYLGYNALKYCVRCRCRKFWK